MSRPLLPREPLSPWSRWTPFSSALTLRECSLLAGSGEQQGPGQTPPWSGSPKGLSSLSPSHWGLILLGPTQGHPFPRGHLLPGPPRGCPDWPILKCLGLACTSILGPFPSPGWGGLRPPHPPPCAAIRSCRSPHPLMRQGHWLLPPVVWPSPGWPCAAPRLCARGSQCCPVPPASLLTSFSNEHGLSLRAHGHVPFLSLFCTPVPS